MSDARQDYTRDDLIIICERAVVPHNAWSDRDTPRSQEGVGKVWAFLRAGCDFRVLISGDLVTDDRTIWLEIDHDDFGTRDWGGPGDTELFYLPTPNRLDATDGEDWY